MASIVTTASTLRRNLAALISGKDLLSRISSEENAKLEEMERARFVIQELIHRHYGGMPLPPPELRLHVGLKKSEIRFWAQGISSSMRVLELFGESPTEPVLDWGCGSGRTLMWLQAFEGWQKHYHGCDVDSEAIAWLQQQGPFNVDVCQPSPPLPYTDGHFAGIFSFSVLTHIPPERHRDWYEDLHRVLRPGGLAFITTQGWRILDSAGPPMTDAHRHELRRQGSCWVPIKGHYKDAAFVTEDYTKEQLSGLFTVEEFRPGGYANMDAYRLRKT
jgi:SAM-dependent methyltransferase